MSAGLQSVPHLQKDGIHHGFLYFAELIKVHHFVDLIKVHYKVVPMPKVMLGMYIVQPAGSVGAPYLDIGCFLGRLGKIICSLIGFLPIVSGLRHWELATCLESCVLCNGHGARVAVDQFLARSKIYEIVAHIGD